VSQAVRGVCFILPELDRIGGYELATVALVGALRAHNVPVCVVTTITHSTTHSTVVAATPDAVYIKTVGRRTLLAMFPRLLATLARRRSTFSIIHCPTFGYLSGLAVLAGRILRRPTLLRVATENDVGEFANAQHWKARLFFRLLRTASGVIAPSKAIRNELLQAGFSNNKIFLLPNGVDVERFRPATPSERAAAAETFGSAGDKLVIGTVARLVHRKGIDVLLHAFATVLRTHRAQLLVVGDGELGDDLRELTHELGLDCSVSWVGLQADTSTWLRRMDVFVLPSRLEGSPNAVLEAMATGLPIVATRIGGIVDLLEDGRTGLLVPPGDAEALALALGRFLCDATFRAGLGSRARTRAVREFSLPGSIARLIDVYRDLQSA
jgi:glycosyltransferase involved in cell wall biosynthesis